MEEKIVILLDLIILGFVLYGVFKKEPTRNSEFLMQSPIIPKDKKRPLLRPFVKQEKLRPKVNDDFKAWQEEKINS